jgi:hypothetical protein
VVRYAFTVRDSHPLLLAGLPAHIGFDFRGDPPPSVASCRLFGLRSSASAYYRRVQLVPVALTIQYRAGALHAFVCLRVAQLHSRGFAERRNALRSVRASAKG